MARSFATLERFFERLLERPAARLFRARLQPVQLQRRLERAMEARRVVSADRTYVPNRYRVLLHPSDLETFDGYRATLETDLAEALLRRARSRGYRLVARPEVYLLPADSVAEGDIDIDADVLDPSLVRSAAAGLRPVGLEGPRPPRPPIPGTAPVMTGRDAHHAPAAADEAWSVDGPAVVLVAAPALAGFAEPAAVPASAALGQASGPGPFGDVRAVPTDGPLPAVSAVPHEPAPVALALMPAMANISVQPSGAVGWDVPFRGTSVSVGRGMDNEIVLLDDRVSRHHGRFTARQGTLVYTDLGSTNGSFVGRAPVREIALGVGDVVRVGSSTLTIRPPS